MNPIRPAAHAARGMVAARMIDALLGALSKVLPSRVPAAGEGGLHMVLITGMAESGQHFVARCNSNLEGWGGRPGLDGIDGTSPFQANIAISGVEEMERHRGVIVLQRAYRVDSGGAGRWRGGLGQVNDVRFLGNQGFAVLRSGRRDYLPVASLEEDQPRRRRRSSIRGLRGQPYCR
jgi:N-methylhydantoinase B